MKNTMKTSGKCEYSKKPGDTSHTYNIMKYINILTTPQNFYKLYVYNCLSHWRSEDNLSWRPPAFTERVFPMFIISKDTVSTSLPAPRSGITMCATVPGFLHGVWN